MIKEFLKFLSVISIVIILVYFLYSFALRDILNATDSQINNSRNKSISIIGQVENVIGYTIDFNIYLLNFIGYILTLIVF